MSEELARDLLEQIVGLLGQHASEIVCGFADDIPRSAPFQPRSDERCEVEHMLAELGTTLPDTQPFTRAALQCGGELGWRQYYSAAEMGERFVQNSAWLPIVESQGPLVSRESLVEIMLLAPNLTYPMRSHGPEELYLMLSGRMRGEIEGQEPLWVGPGEFLHHLPWQPHELKTGDQGALVLTIWRGGFEKPVFATEMEGNS